MTSKFAEIIVRSGAQSERPDAKAAGLLDEYFKAILARPYTRELIQSEDGTWCARVLEFVGCMSKGDNAEEAIENLEHAMSAWVDARIAEGESIPDPLEASL